jgi:hypothetical protein
VIDSHTHLDSTPGSDGENVAAAREAGVTRILTIGTDAESSRRAPTRSARSPPTSSWRASSASRSSSTPAPPTTTRSPRSPATPGAST